MPWTVSDVDRFKKGLTQSQKQQWVRIANSALQNCLNKGGNRQNCEASAIRQANGTVGGHMESYIQINRSYHSRVEMLNGKRHIVVPVVMMVEGVHNGSQGPLLHLADELGHFPGSWDGIPVTVEHPRDDEGSFVSANSPGILEEYNVGKVFNTHVENNKLKAEVWLEEDRLTTVSPEALEYVNQGRPLEVSVGVFTDEEQTEGEWNGEQYIAIARNHRPDHLALLPGGVGACSWEDGCGIRVNERFTPPESGNAPRGVKDILARVYNDCRSRWVRDHPNDRENQSNKTSCSRVAWNAVENAGWRKRGNRWIKTNEKGGNRVEKNELLNIELLAEDNTDVLTVLKKFHNQGYILHEITTNVEKGFKELVQNAQVKLDRMDDDTKIHFLQEIYNTYMVYEIRRREQGGSELYKRDYSVGNDGSIEFTCDPVRVQRNVEYVTMESKFSKLKKFFSNNKSKEVKTMSKEGGCTPCEKINQLIAHELTNFTEDDREFLTALEEAHLDKLFPKEKKKEEPTVQQKKDDINPEQAIEVLKKSLTKPEDFMKLMPDEMREQINTGLAVHRAQRANMVKTIVDNSNGIWKEDDLKKMEFETLKKIHDSIIDNSKTDYSVLGTEDLRDNVTVNEDLVLLPPGVKLAEEDKKQ